MLQMRPSCEHCGADLPMDATHARSCTFECTFCAACARDLLGDVCPNCSGELLPRPMRPAALWEVAPASTERVEAPVDLDAHPDRLATRPIDGDHPGVALRRYARAWLAGDLDTVIASYDDGFVLHYGGHSELAGDHVGRDAALAAMAEASVRAPRTLVSVDDILVGDDGGALVVTETLARDGETATLRRVLRYRVSGGRLQECWLHDEQQEVIDRFWRPDGS